MILTEMHVCSSSLVAQEPDGWTGVKRSITDWAASIHFSSFTVSLYFCFSQLIQKRNSEGHAYTLIMNQFGDLTVDEYRSLMLGRGSRFFKETTQHGSSFLPSSGVTLPNTVDWRTKGYVTPVKNQGTFLVLVVCTFYLSIFIFLHSCNYYLYFEMLDKNYLYYIRFWRTIPSHHRNCRYNFVRKLNL